MSTKLRFGGGDWYAKQKIFYTRAVGLDKGLQMDLIGRSISDRQLLFDWPCIKIGGGWLMNKIWREI